MLDSGQIIQNRYQLQTILGENPVRPTWLARDLQSDFNSSSLVVIKLLSLGGEVQWEHLKLFEREAQILQNLDHPQIPQYRDYFSLDDRSLWFGLVQDYIQGSSLKNLLTQKKRFVESQVRQIATQVLQILIYLHELNPAIIHRDIKPSNILLGEDKKIYLLDFGSVQDRPQERGGTFTVVGTYGYTPMEQFGGKAVASSDLYALGATLIHLLTGVTPSELPQKNLRLQFKNYTTISPDFAKWLDRLIEPALEKRFKSAREAVKELIEGPKIKPERINKETEKALVKNNSGCGINSIQEVPSEIKGWNWGAFFLPLFWSFPNQVWIGILSLVPGIGFMVAVLMGVKGNQWAWKSRKWVSIEQFKKHQKGWAIAGMIIMGLPSLVFVWMFIALISGISSTPFGLIAVPLAGLIYFAYQNNK
ncbi:MAG: serine/threonine protein kinase [Prochloraceae cyanobacterium]